MSEVEPCLEVIRVVEKVFGRCKSIVTHKRFSNSIAGCSLVDQHGTLRRGNMSTIQLLRHGSRGVMRSTRGTNPTRALRAARASGPASVRRLSSSQGGGGPIASTSFDKMERGVCFYFVFPPPLPLRSLGRRQDAMVLFCSRVWSFANAATRILAGEVCFRPHADSRYKPVNEVPEQLASSVGADTIFSPGFSIKVRTHASRRAVPLVF